MQVKPESNSRVICMGGPTIPNNLKQTNDDKTKGERKGQKNLNMALVTNLNKLAIFCWTKVDICANHVALRQVESNSEVIKTRHVMYVA